MTMRIRSRTAAWLALAAMALNAFWPLLANAKPSTPALPSEICSATGLQHGIGGAPADSPHKSVRPTHCSLCPFGAERVSAMPFAKHVLLSPLPTRAQPAAHSDAPRPEAAFHPAAPARAPPLLS